MRVFVIKMLKKRELTFGIYVKLSVNSKKYNVSQTKILALKLLYFLFSNALTRKTVHSREEKFSRYNVLYVSVIPVVLSLYS